MKTLSIAMGILLLGGVSLTALSQTGTHPQDGVDARKDSAEFARPTRSR